MATRRSRLVIRPNIKPAPAKTSSAQSKETSSKGTSGSEASPLVKAPPSKGSESPSKTTPNKALDSGSPSKVTKVSRSSVKNANTSVTVTDTALHMKDGDESIRSVKEAIELNRDSNSDKVVASPTNSKDDDQQKSEDTSTDQNHLNKKDSNEQQQTKEKKEPARSSRRSRIAIKPNIRPAAVKVGASLSKEKSLPTTSTSITNHTETPTKTAVISSKETKTPDKTAVSNEDTDIFKNVKTLSLSTPVVVPSSPPSSPAPAEEPPFVQPTVAEMLLGDDSKIIVGLKDTDCMSVSGSYEVPCSDTMSVALEDEQRGELGEEKDIKKKFRRKTKKPEVENQHPREKSPDRQKMKMGDLLFWNPNQNSIPAKAKKSLKKELVNSVMTTEKAAIDIDHEEKDEEASNDSSSLPAPQIMIGPDGNIMLNMDSTLIKADKREATIAIEEDEDDRYLNSNSYRTTKKASMWTETETEMWFLGLSMCGTDFSLLTHLMPHRSRRDLKNKFRREERKNRPLIDKALANRRKYDPEPFEFMKNRKEKPDKKVLLKKEKKEKAVEKKKIGNTTDEKVEKEKIQKALKRKNPKKKEVESENEEDDWGPDEDYEILCEEDPSVPSQVKRSKKDVKSEQSAPVAVSPQSTGPTKTYSKTQPMAEASASPASPALPRMTEISETNRNSSGIQAIPGSTQVQIEMEGVQNPVQGVLIPSNMVPTIAPKLGIHNATAGMQVLLVQEETDSGSLVHVYIIPEGTQPSSALSGISGFRPAAQPDGPGDQSPAASSPGHATSGQQQVARQVSPTSQVSPSSQVSPASQVSSARRASPSSHAMHGNPTRHASPAMHGHPAMCVSPASPVSPVNTPVGRNFPDRYGHLSPASHDIHRQENSFPTNTEQSPTIRQQLSSTPNQLNNVNQHPFNIPHRSPMTSPTGSSHSSNHLPITNSFPGTMPPPLTPIQNSTPQHHTSSLLTHNSARQLSSPRRPPPPLVSSSPRPLPPDRLLPRLAPADSTPPTPSSNLIEMQPAQAFPHQSMIQAPKLDLVKEMNKSLNKYQSDF